MLLVAGVEGGTVAGEVADVCGTVDPMVVGAAIGIAGGALAWQATRVYLEKKARRVD